MNVPISGMPEHHHLQLPLSGCPAHRADIVADPIQGNAGILDHLE